MNRRSFLRNLALGAASLPVAVKALAVTKAAAPAVAALDVFDCTDMDFKPPSPAMRDIARHIAETDPYASLVGSCPHAGPWFDGQRWRVIDNRTNEWVIL